MRIDRGLLNWGVFLIALGGVPLAVQQGWAEVGIAGRVLQLWPLIFVGIGLGMILRWTPLAWFGGALVAFTIGVIFGALLAGGISGISSACVDLGSGETAATTRTGSTASSSFTLDLKLSCGQLTLAREDGTSWSVDAVHAPDEPPAIEATSSALTVDEERDDFFLFGPQARSEWTIGLPATAAIDVGVTLNAADSEMDLGVGPVSRVEGTFNLADVDVDMAGSTLTGADGGATASLGLTFNAASGRLALPAGSLHGQMTLNASSLELCVPAGAELRIEHQHTLSSDDLDRSGLTQVGDGWQTAGYDTAPSRIDLSIDSTVSSVSLARPEVCP